MQSITIESEKITLPLEVISKLKGKKIQFIEFQDGFIMKPVRDFKQETRKHSKLARLKPRKLIKGDPDELVDLKVGEWREPNNL